MAECNSTKKNIEAENELKLLTEKIIECIQNECSDDSSKEVAQLNKVICSMKERAAVANILSNLLSLYVSAKDTKIENVDLTNVSAKDTKIENVDLTNLMDLFKHKNLDSLNVKREIPNSSSSNQNAEKPRGSELETSHNFTGNKGPIYYGCNTVSHANGPDVLKCQTEIDKLKKHIDDLNTSLDDKTKEVLNIGKENESLNKELNDSAAKSQEADSVKDKNKELNRALIDKKDELDTKEKHIENLEAEKFKWKETIDVLEKENTKLKQELDNHRKTCENQKNQIKNLKSELNNKNTEIENLNHQISESRLKPGDQETGGNC